MGAFEKVTQKVKDTPGDLPDAAKAVSEGHSDGAIFRSEPSGRRFRLRYAGWTEVLPRKAKADGSKPKTK